MNAIATVSSQPGLRSRLRRFVMSVPLLGSTLRRVKARLRYNPTAEMLAELRVSLRHELRNEFAEMKTRLMHHYADYYGSLAEESKGANRWLGKLAENQRGMTDWLGLLTTKLEMTALDVRERVAPRPASALETRVVDPAAFEKRVAAMGRAVRVNLGCGERPLPEYLNIDFRELPGVDAVSDVLHLPFGPGSLAEIASAHLVEHFRQHQLATVILPYWKSLLHDDGFVRIVCPDWEGMLARLADGRMSYPAFKKITFGAQDYEGDDHFSMYTPASLTEVLHGAGFSRVVVEARDRLQGGCPEMELVAHR